MEIQIVTNQMYWQIRDCEVPQGYQLLMASKGLFKKVIRICEVKNWQLSIPAELNAGVRLAPKARQNAPNYRLEPIEYQMALACFWACAYLDVQIQRKKKCFQE